VGPTPKTRLIRKVLTTGVLALALVGAAGGALPKVQPDFYTPGYAAYCYETYHEEALTCVTPNDGFSVYMFPIGRVPRTGDIDIATGNRVTNPEYRQEGKGLRNVNRATGGLLRFGYRWNEWQDLRVQYSCVSQKTGLTCRNRSGHGWWIGRFRGFRIF
jgi:hypothetical protein